MKIKSVVNTVLISFVLALLPTQVSALSADPQISPDYSQGYERKLFGIDWIDADKNGCNTRSEVLIAEAVVKPKVGKKCALTGGKWVSASADPTDVLVPPVSLSLTALTFHPPNSRWKTLTIACC